MLIETGHDLKSARGMMNLVQGAPKNLRFVAEAMPPIIDKGREHVGKGGGGGVWQRGREMEKRPVGQPVIPGLPSQDGNHQLN